MKRFPILALAAAVTAAFSLSACSTFGGRSDYTEAVETRPLEVPPDLDTPAAANELSVPGARATAAAEPVALPPQVLHFDGDVADTYKRVDAALTKTTAGKIANRNEAAHTLEFDFDQEVDVRSKSRGFFGSVLGHLGFGNSERVQQRVYVSVIEDGAGSRIVVDPNGTDRKAGAAAKGTAQELSNLIPGANLIVPEPVRPRAPAVVVSPQAGAAPVTGTSVPPPISGVRVGDGELHIADGVDNAWRRVGLALERAQLGTLSASDAAAHTYTLDFNATVEAQPEPKKHWYSRLLHPFGGGSGKSEAVNRALTVRVSADGDGAKVSVEGDTSDKATADAARRVMQVLRERLS